MKGDRVYRLLYCVLYTFADIFGARIYAQSSDEVQEICPAETFHAECSEVSVVIITSARYGRMQLGRCVRQNLGFLGCQRDVSAILDSLCSGRKQCDVTVPNQRLDMTQPCHSELKSYLEVRYTCEEVVSPMNQCSPGPVKLTRPHGILSSSVAMSTGCGLETSPWVIQAEPGQRISVTLHDYSYSEISESGTSDFGSDCSEYAFIIDTFTGQKVRLCARGLRSAQLYTSSNNSLQVALRSSVVMTDSRHFLIEYTFTGCADLPMASDMIFERQSESSAKVRCLATNRQAENSHHKRLSSKHTYNVHCDVTAGQWVGDWHNCSTVLSSSHDVPISDNTDSPTIGQWVIVAGASAIVVLLFCCVVATLVWCFNRLRRQRQDPYYHYGTSTQPSGGNGHYISAQRDNQANMKQLHLSGIQGPDMDFHEQHTVYRPLMPASNPCQLCHARSQGQLIDEGNEPLYEMNLHKEQGFPRVFNNCTATNKRSNIYKGCGDTQNSEYGVAKQQPKKNNSSEIPRNKTFKITTGDTIVRKVPETMPSSKQVPSCKCATATCTRTLRRTKCSCDEELKPLNQDLNGDMMPESSGIDEATMYSQKQRIHNEQVQNSVLNNTL